MIVYKITNNINNKVYIGLTTCTLQYRWQRHITESKNLNNKKHLYKAMRKYGVENFQIEQIAFTNNFKKLGELERKYIKKYDSQNPEKGYNLTAGGEKNQWDGNPASKLTFDEVVQIREIYSMCELSCKECWRLFKYKISYSGFQKVWDGITWHGIMDEIYTKENIEKHKKQKGKQGEKNHNTKFTNEEVMKIRFYYVNHTLQETYEKFGIPKNYTKDGIRGILNQSFLFLPIYKKMKRKWFLNNKEIDIKNYKINDYKPVSTIPVIEEVK